MSTAVSTCCCGSVGAEKRIRFCPDHHRYFLGDKELASVSKVLRVLPQGMCSSCGWPIYSNHVPGCDVRANIDHARERGIRVDRYAQEFIRSGRCRVPAGEWTEVRELLKKLIPWLEAGGLTKARTQVIVHDEEIAGTMDFVLEHFIQDLKCTYDVDKAYRLQLGAYADLYQKTFGVEPVGVGVIHVTARYAQPRWNPFNLHECREDWQTVKAMWRLSKRLAA